VASNGVLSVVVVVLGYILIFGRFGFPKMGIAGAGWATVIAGTVSSTIYFCLYLLPSNNRAYATRSSWRFDKDLFVRMLRFGMPSGFHFMLDLVGFTFFLTFIGQISTWALAASSMAFQINTLAFMPMTGFATAVSTLVGQYLGSNKPDLAERSTWSATYITMTYMLVLALGYILIPNVFMYPFGAEADPAQFEAIRHFVVVLLGFVAFYSIFDTGNIIFSAAIKGAGDTRFVMIVSLVLNWIILVIPSYVAVTYMSGSKGLYTAWTAATVYVSVLGIVFFLRFLGGKWKSMRVIEAASPASPKCPPLPASEVDEPM
jgi:MATE family multidrug resistance protein